MSELPAGRSAASPAAGEKDLALPSADFIRDLADLSLDRRVEGYVRDAVVLWVMAEQAATVRWVLSGPPYQGATHGA
jgi:hypothetical protein